MSVKIVPWRSLKTRVTIVTLAIFVIGIWSLAFYSSRKLHNDLRRLLSDQQFSVVTLVAEEVNQELGDRLVVLERVAKRVSPALLGDAVALQAFLEERLILQGPFNSEVVVYRHDGTAVGRVPRSKGLVNFRPADGDPVAAALTAGKTTVGRPVVDTALRAGVFGMAVPIRDPQGVVIGALVGVTNLAQSNFLDRITGHRYGKTGHYFIVAPRERLLVMSSNRSRIMEKLPGPGVIAWLDRAFEGYEGSAVYQNQFGEEMLASDKRVPVAGWIVAASLPTAEAFAPIHALQRRMLLAAVLLSLLAGALIWWMLWRQLAPLMATATRLASLSHSDAPLTSLPIERQDEIGQLIGGFNRLLVTLRERENALRESEFRWKFAIDGSGDGLWDWNVSEGTVFYSRRLKEMLGFADEEIGNGLDEWQTRVHPGDLTPTMAAVQAMLDGTKPLYASEYRVRSKDGSWKWILGRGVVVSRDADGAALRVIGTHRDITERKAAGEALQETEDRYRGLVESAFEGIVIHRDGIILDASVAYATMFGYTRDELLGKPVLDMSAPDVRDAVAGIIKLGNEVPYDTVGQRKDGSVFAIETAGRAGSYGGRPARIAAVRDISTRRQAEEELRRTSQWLLATQRISAVGGWAINLKTGAVWASPEARRIYGYAGPELTIPVIQAFPLPGCRPALDRALKGLVEDGTPYDIEFQVARGTDGAIVDIHSLAEYDPVEQLVLGVVVDITAHKRAEQALRESEERFRVLFEGAPDAILLADPLSGKILDANAAACRLLARERDEIVTLHQNELHPIRNSGDSAQNFRRHVVESQMMGLTHPIEDAVLRSDGTEVPVEILAHLIQLGEQRMLIGTFRDITERKEAEVSLRALLRDKEALLKEVHHRVKNNLQVITSLLRLEAGRSAHVETTSVLAEMQGRIQSMALLHETLYRADSFAGVDLGSYLTQLATEGVRALSAQSGAIRLHVDTTSVHVGMDQAVPCGLLVNELLSNCIKHGFPEGGTGDVRIELHRVDGGSQLCLRVSDSGVGLPADFESKRGKSLGLQLVSDLAGQLGGRLEIGPGPVAVFTVIFTADEPTSSATST